MIEQESMEQIKQNIVAYFKEQNAPLSIEEVHMKYSEFSVSELETILDVLWEEDVLCKLESFCSILYTLE